MNGAGREAAVVRLRRRTEQRLPRLGIGHRQATDSVALGLPDRGRAGPQDDQLVTYRSSKVIAPSASGESSAASRTRRACSVVSRTGSGPVAARSAVEPVLLRTSRGDTAQKIALVVAASLPGSCCRAHRRTSASYEVLVTRDPSARPAPFGRTARALTRTPQVADPGVDVGPRIRKRERPPERPPVAGVGADVERERRQVAVALTRGERRRRRGLSCADSLLLRRPVRDGRYVAW